MHIDPTEILRYVCEDNITVAITTLAVTIIWPHVRHDATKFPDLTAISLPLWEHHPTTTVPFANMTACKKFETLVVLNSYVFVDYGLYCT